ncbi:hypothetical protein GE061_019261 [Apolygus lucorum]|uniref:Uncharacterized protein n=1 Tax=Apolygus lucorum TaxID=248454 RepID=A0A6A4JW18_APOLU|nr:hypothetical protein GE061_019261 [Apolygus lucorum]
MLTLFAMLFISLVYGAKPPDPAFERTFSETLCKGVEKITCYGGDYELKCICGNKGCWWTCNRKFWDEIHKEWARWNGVHGKKTKTSAK